MLKVFLIPYPKSFFVFFFNPPHLCSLLLLSPSIMLMIVETQKVRQEIWRGEGTNRHGREGMGKRGFWGEGERRGEKDLVRQERIGEEVWKKYRWIGRELSRARSLRIEIYT